MRGDELDHRPVIHSGVPANQRMRMAAHRRGYRRHIDVVAVNEAPGSAARTPRRPRRPVACLQHQHGELLDTLGVDRRVSFVSHGTTVATNAILESKYARLGLLSRVAIARCSISEARPCPATSATSPGGSGRRAWCRWNGARGRRALITAARSTAADEDGARGSLRVPRHGAGRDRGLLHPFVPQSDARTPCAD